MNYILNNQSHDTIKYFIWIYFALFSLFYWFPIVHRIGNILHEGLSALWLSFLYIIGGYIKKFGIKSLLGLEEIITPPLKKQILHISKMQIKSKLYCHILGVIFCVIITHTLSILTNKISHSDNYMHNIVNNISPSILILSIFMLKIFASIQVNNIHFIKIIEFLTPLTFGVYLIHVHKCIYNILIKDLFVWISDAPIYLLWEYILISALCIFIICILIDYMRFKLFRFLHI